MIPKIIHYCWLSDDSVPDNLRNYMKTWREKLPGYEFVLWNFDRFDKQSSEWVSEAFDSKKYAFAADYIRLYAVYTCGGIYMDMDIEVVRNFEPLLDGSLMMAYENDNKDGIEAGCFGAEKGNAVVGEILEYYGGRRFIKDDGSFDTLPLPRIMYRYTSRHPELRIYEKDYFTVKNFRTGAIDKTERTYAVHHFAGSWVSGSMKRLLEEKEWIRTHIRIKFLSWVLQRLCVLKKITADFLTKMGRAQSC